MKPWSAGGPTVKLGAAEAVALDGEVDGAWASRLGLGLGLGAVPVPGLVQSSTTTATIPATTAEAPRMRARVVITPTIVADGALGASRILAR